MLNRLEHYLFLETFHQSSRRQRRPKRHRETGQLILATLPVQRTYETYQYNYLEHELGTLREQYHYQQQQLAAINWQIQMIRELLSKSFTAFDTAYRDFNSIQEQPAPSDDQSEPMFF